MILWLAMALLALTAGGGLGLFLWTCGRRSVPDARDEGALLRTGRGERREEIQEGTAWLGTKRLTPVQTGSDDGLNLHGMLLTQKNAYGTVLLFHDAGSSWQLDFSGVARFFYEQRLQILFADQRGHGGSEGRFFTWGIWERFDIRAWCNYAAFRFGDDHPLWLYGMGMGGSAALMASALELPGNVRGVIAEGAGDSPWSYLGRTLNRVTGLPAAPLLWLIDLYAALARGFSLREYSAAAALREGNYPVLLLQGTEDALAPPETAAALLESCRAEKRLCLVRGAQHGLCRWTDPVRTEDEILDFMDSFRLDAAQ